MKKTKFQTNVLWSTLAWITGIAVIFIIWTILSVTVFKDGGQLPNIGKCFIAFGQQLTIGYNWLAILIAWLQTLACFVGSFAIAIALAILGRCYNRVQYFITPIITLCRALPTIILMVLIAVFLITVLPLVPIVVAFFVIFPMAYEGVNTAINNVDKKNIEMANVFHVSKIQQIKNVYIPAILPYLFSSFVAAFGLTFKIAIASQTVQGLVTVPPDYPSVGGIIAEIIAGLKKHEAAFETLIAWGMIAILLSLIMELIIKEIGRLCMPFKYNDRKHIANFFNHIRRNHE